MILQNKLRTNNYFRPTAQGDDHEIANPLPVRQLYWIILHKVSIVRARPKVRLAPDCRFV